MRKKECTKCGEVKGVNKFSRNKDGAFGRRATCKDCMKPYFSELYEKNRDKIIANSLSYYANNRESVRAYQDEYLDKNRELINSKRRARYHAAKAGSHD